MLLLAVVVGAPPLLTAKACGQTPGSSTDTSDISPGNAGEQFSRAVWLFHQRAYPLGLIPSGAYLRALRRIRAIKEEAGRSIAAQSALPGRWTSIGPTPLLEFDGSFENQAMSGAVSSIAVDPPDLNHWLIGANSGGVWETRDAGTTWAPKTDDQASLVMGAVAFAPGNPSIVYAGTGRGEPLSLFGAGLLKSVNGGTAWQLIATSPFAHNAFKELKLHPANADVVIAATNTEAFAGEDHNTGPPARPRTSSMIRCRNSGEYAA